MFFEILLQCLLFSFAFSHSKHPTLIVVSYDAFRYNFFEKNVTPNMEKLKRTGTYADYLINVFPTKTFPNHHSIATGLYPEKHGVVGNSFFDPTTNDTIKYSHQMFHYNENVVPIWRLNEDAGEERYSGVMMWPGGSFQYQNTNPAYVQAWDPTYDWQKRIDTVISWITNPKKPANLVMLYFEEPDTHGHAFGPNSKTVLNLIRDLDNITQYLEDQLIVNNLVESVNVVHLSDHGLSAVTPEHFINLTQYLIPDTYRIAGSTPCLHIIPNEGYADEIYQALQKASQENKHFTVYKKEEMPIRWHFKNNPRTPPILVLADEGYGFQDLAENAFLYGQKYNFKVTSSSEFGVHGYDYEVPNMRPFFMIRGPKIYKDYKVAPFHTVDLFELFCAILEIQPTSNDGSYRNIKSVLSKSKVFTHFTTVLIVVGGILSALMLTSCAAALTLLMIKRQQSITTTAALNKRFPQNFHHCSIEAQHLLEPEDA